MKKLYIIPYLLLPIFFFIGCTQTNKTLARNLDSTISSLIYSVGNLDLLDSNMLTSVNVITNNLNKNINKVARTSTDLILKLNENEGTCKDDSDNPNIENQDAIADSNKQNSIILKENDDILDDTQSNNPNDSDSQNKDLESDDSGLNSAILNNKLNNNELFLQYKSENAENNINNYGEKNVINSENISPNTIDNYANDIAISHTLPTETDTTYGDIYTSLEASSKRIENLIADLVNIRSVIMLYISDLYNGSINLSSEDIKSINSYANIIKESTAYLKANIGSVKNHINEASELAENSENISLANSHIIRATETLNTRCAKLESAIVATYNIADIIKNSDSGKTASTSGTDSDDLTLTENTSINGTPSAPYGEFNFWSGSPNYAMNNPYNMGVNGMRYTPYATNGYNGGINYNYGYNGFNGNYNNMNPYAYQNFYAPFAMPYGYMNQGTPFAPNYENFPTQYYGNFNSNYGNGYMIPNFDNGINYPYNLNNPSYFNNDIGMNNNENIIGDGIVGNNAPIPNILTGLVSSNDQEQLSNKISEEKNSDIIYNSNDKILNNNLNMLNKSTQKLKQEYVPKRVG
ncbi:MAG: hypothetical protein IJT25_03155 [Clostridia bacterium]|nr:hypothetical protein [Clostridia bacterium]